MRKVILSVIGVLFIVGSFLFAMSMIANKNKPKPVPEKVVKTVYTDTVQNTTIPIVIPANGSLVAKRRVELYAEVQGIFQTSGKLFKPGQKYRGGEHSGNVDGINF